MDRFAVRTLTLNPSIDVSSEAERVEPERKIRTCAERIDPGGGGINVARVLHRLGVAVEAIYCAGGATGRAFDDLIDRTGMTRRRIDLEDDTRTSLTIHERSGGREFRFVPEGPTLSQAEVAETLAAVSAANSDFFVASGSLPPGVPADFYARAGDAARKLGARFVLDTSGDELEAALHGCGIALLKASKEEMDRDAARAIARRGCVEMVALTLGADGALMISAEEEYYLPTLKTEPVSTVGAGDSFLAGLTFGLATGKPPLEAFRIAVAAGAAATLEPGTEVAHAETVARLLPSVPQPERTG